MIPRCQQHYQTLERRLATLASLPPPDGQPPRSEHHSQAWLAEIREIQQFFRDQILCLPLDTLAISPQVQSYQTEIQKQLQLLAMDATFLQAARQPATQQQRQTQFRDRLATLNRYCRAILEMLSPES
ncbi:hypothetical protein DO97_08985 [Neosynechococcus sphagnicola sy1]|uniref:Heterocyst frequency control protein PatD n=1 Tax=Neosynechococcus sphagnicola sy1 TaxID=1497020 RepID=A0A098TJL9_9CYAN|nr:hypothetical protein DO97_08985 [Neosynechococcus sphagnicola sy1]